MMLFFNDNESKGKIVAEEFIVIGKRYGIPTFNDAAADVPPTENLSKYTRMGFDLVTFSGGKGMRGPQKEAEAKEWDRRTKLLADSVRDIQALDVEIFIPPIANHVPHLKLTWNQEDLGLSADCIRQQLRDGNVSIEAIPIYSYEPSGYREEIRFGVWMMLPGETEIVAQRLREIFRKTRISSQTTNDG